jgi:hypothetical protein
MLLRCEKCGVKNYLDPYPFWTFKGKTRCAGCGTYYALEIAGGAAVRAPAPTQGTPRDPDLKLPGFADTPDFKPVTGEGKTRPAPRARADVHGRPKPIVRNSRGRLVAGRPLKPEDLVGSRARYVLEGKEPT